MASFDTVSLYVLDFTDRKLHSKYLEWKLIDISLNNPRECTKAGVINLNSFPNNIKLLMKKDKKLPHKEEYKCFYFLLNEVETNV